MFEPPGQGAEVHSLMRESEFQLGTYLSRFFNTGREVQQRTAQG